MDAVDFLAFVILFPAAARHVIDAHDTLVHGIGDHDHSGRIDGDVSRTGKISRPGPVGPITDPARPVDIIQSDDAVVTAIGNVDFSVVSDCDPLGIAEVACARTICPVGDFAGTIDTVHPHDPVIAGIGDVYPVVRSDGHRARLRIPGLFNQARTGPVAYVQDPAVARVGDIDSGRRGTAAGTA